MGFISMPFDFSNKNTSSVQLNMHKNTNRTVENL